jgi:hypothetical protein
MVSSNLLSLIFLIDIYNTKLLFISGLGISINCSFFIQYLLLVLASYYCLEQIMHYIFIKIEVMGGSDEKSFSFINAYHTYFSWM